MVELITDGAFAGNGEEKRLDVLGKTYPFFRPHLKALHEYRTRHHLKPVEFRMLLTYSFWMDYPAAYPGIAHFVGTDEKTVRRDVENIRENYRDQWDEIEATLERIRGQQEDQDVASPETFTVTSYNRRADSLYARRKISEEDFTDLTEHTAWLKSQGYSRKAIIVEVLFQQGFDYRISQADYAELLGVCHQSIQYICYSLKREGMPLPASLFKPK